MTDELKTLFDVVDRLDAASIEYMLTGSFAMAFYSAPRMTRDIDIVIKVNDGDVEKLFAAFKEHYYIDKGAVSRSIRSRHMFNAIDNETIVKVDFIVQKSDEFRLAEFARRNRLEITGRHVWVTSPEDLVLSKLICAKDSDSELQLRDVRNLLGSGTEISAEYARGWADKLGVACLLTRAMQNE